jgi:tetratricopeptide (TPR) repeat protein
VGITASNLGAALYYDGDLAEAVRVQEAAVSALTRAVGPDHQRSLLALANLAAFKHVARDWDGAEREYRLLLERQIAARGRAHPLTAHVMSSLASVLTAGASGPADPALAEAGRLFREALALREARLGAEHPEVGLALTRLANHLVDVGEVPEGVRRLERAVSILVGAYGEVHPDVADAMYRLANARWHGGDFTGALALHRRALRVFDSVPGTPRIESLWARASFCDHLFSVPGNAAEAGEVCARAAEGLRAAPAGQRRMLPRTQLRLAQAHLALGNRAAADSLVRMVRAIGEPELGDAPLLDSLGEALGEGR